jgi:hypothetical protein
MGWLTSIAGIARIKWLPYMVIFWLTSAGGVGMWSYMKGKSVMERKLLEEINKAKEEQLKELKRVHDADLETLVHSLAKEQEIEGDVEDIEFPEIQPDCEHALHDWMRHFDDAIETANASTRGAD